MNYYQKEQNVTEAALAAGVDWKTARRYIEGAAPPGSPRPPRSWRTHEDVFAKVWPEVESFLRQEKFPEAKALFEELCRRHPGRFNEGQLRSFQRRVKLWRRLNGPVPEVLFRQEHRPGERLQLDWFDARDLEVSIGGQVWSGKVCQQVLPYSNWQWASLCSSESFASLRLGLQTALWELGKVPMACQTDQSSTATHPRGKGQRGREWNERYLSLLAHYRMGAEKIAVATPQQNGDVESMHRQLKREINNQLALRGTREFASQEEFERFVQEVCRQRNQLRQEKFQEELALMRELPPARLPEWDEVQCRVNRESLARVGKAAYSVPARWIGESLRARVYEQKVEFYYGTMQVAQAARNHGEGVWVDWRHVLPHLLRKPGAFARWRHRESLFPNAQWRRLWDSYLARYSQGRAEREYLGALALALEHPTEEVIAAAQSFPEPTLDLLRRHFQPALDVVKLDFAPELKSYDRLLEVTHG